MMDAGRHPNIELLTHSELAGLDGKCGDFTATVVRHAGYVDESRCTGCGDCAENCPKVVPDEFDCGLSSRKAIYRPFAQAVPNVFFRDPQACINSRFNTIRCHHCEKACRLDAINYDMPSEEIRIPAASVIVAIGADVYDPGGFKAYSYSVSPNILTGLEFERMLNASGPTGGAILRPSDKARPKTVAFVQCVGVRGEGGHHYCSRFCCMNSVKDALLVKEHQPDVERVTLFYSDLRCFGKGYESLYLRTLERPEIHYFRGKPSKIIESAGSGDLIIQVEDTTRGRPEVVRAEMVVLASAAVPSESTSALAKTLGIELSGDGFFARRDGSDGFLCTSREGIYLCGCAGGPEDIPDSVAQGSGAAARAGRWIGMELMSEKSEPVPELDTAGPPRIGVFLCHCGINIGGVLDIERIQEYVRGLPNVVHVQNDLFLCSDGSQKELQNVIAEKRLNRVVAAACTPRTHEPVFQKTCARAGLNPYLFEMANVRDQCSWVHSSEPQLATLRARDQIRMAVARAAWLQPLKSEKITSNRTVLVLGGGIAGLHSALTLDRLGIPVVLVERGERVGGRLNELHTILPGGTPAQELVELKKRQLAESNVTLLLDTEVEEVSGFIGNFQVRSSSGRHEAGAIILAMGADLYDPGQTYGYKKIKSVVTHLELESMLAGEEVRINGAPVRRAAFIQCVGSRDPEINPHCSRICCGITVKQALQLREKKIDVAVFYRDMRPIGHGDEELYREARGKGVIFMRLADGEKPQIQKTAQGCRIRAKESLAGERVELDADMVVLAAALVPGKAGTEKIRDMLKVPCSPDGFIMERHPKLGPVETLVEGVYACGTVSGPKGIGDSVAGANAAAAKAAQVVTGEAIELSPTTCIVLEEKCRGCGLCVSICEFHAPELVASESGVRVARINEAMCKGCGTCAAWCPTDAIVAKHFTDHQIEAMLDAMLTG